MQKVFVMLSALVFIAALGAPAGAVVTGFVDNPESNSDDWQSDVTALGGEVNTNVNFDSHPDGMLQNNFYSSADGVTLAITPVSSTVVNGQGPGQGNSWAEPVSAGEGVHPASKYLMVEGGVISLTITFSAPVYGAGLFLIDYFDPWNQAPLTISAYAQDGSLLGSYDSVQYNFQTDKLYFMGISSSDGDIGSIVLSADTSSTMDLIGIDDIRFAAAEPAAPEVTADGLLQFFDDAVAAGRLQGTGRFKWYADLQLWLTRKTLASAVKAAQIGHPRRADSKLRNVQRRCDGNRRPKDFVKGAAVAELAEMIEVVRASLGQASDPKFARSR
jgi:hypothetical protein